MIFRILLKLATARECLLVNSLLNFRNLQTVNNDVCEQVDAGDMKERDVSLIMYRKIRLTLYMYTCSVSAARIYVDAWHLITFQTIGYVFIRLLILCR